MAMAGGVQGGPRRVDELAVQRGDTSTVLWSTVCGRELGSRGWARSRSTRSPHGAAAGRRRAGCSGRCSGCRRPDELLEVTARRASTTSAWRACRLPCPRPTRGGGGPRMTVKADVVGFDGLDDRVVLRPAGGRIRRRDRRVEPRRSLGGGGVGRDLVPGEEDLHAVHAELLERVERPGGIVLERRPGREDRLGPRSVHRTGQHGRLRTAGAPAGGHEHAHGHDGREHATDACERARREARSRLGGGSWQAVDNNEGNGGRFRRSSRNPGALAERLPIARERQSRVDGALERPLESRLL